MEHNLYVYKVHDSLIVVLYYLVHYELLLVSNSQEYMLFLLNVYYLAHYLLLNNIRVLFLAKIWVDLTGRGLAAITLFLCVKMKQVSVNKLGFVTQVSIENQVSWKSFNSNNKYRPQQQIPVKWCEFDKSEGSRT